MVSGPGATDDRSDATQLLRRLREGDEAAFDHLFPILYRQLHALAQTQRTRGHRLSSLNTTALLHETYIKLAGTGRKDWRDRAHFLAVSATAMRQILIDRARGRRAQKRGGGARTLRLDDIREALASQSGLTDERMDALLALDESLGRLEEVSPRQHRIVECRFFGGMTVRDTAEVLGVSPATVKRGWAMALSWLYRDMKRAIESSAPTPATGP
jgi:RNA polymerase sigma factor (TIGR02999 family)